MSPVLERIGLICSQFGLHDMLKMNVDFNLLSKIAKKSVTTKANDNSGLLSGKMGQAIFLFEYSKIDVTYYNHAGRVLEEIFESIYNGELFHSYCSGLSGICSGLIYLYQEKFIKSDDELVSEEIEIYLDLQLKACIQQNNYDFLHGAIGVSLFFYERYLTNKLKYKNQLKLVLDYLSESAITEFTTIKWGNNASGKIKYDLSLAHGISSIIIFLCKMIDTEIYKSAYLKSMIRGATNFLLQQKNDISKCNSFFPYSSKEMYQENENSRLAWCYGDLGISLALLSACKILNDKNLLNFALEVLHHACSRKDMESNLIKDAAICHGTAGIALVFYIIYLKTNDAIFSDATTHWVNKTIELCDFTQNKEDMKVFYNFHSGTYDTQLGLLEGLSGIGLTLLSIYQHKFPKWSKFLLINK